MTRLAWGLGLLAAVACGQAVAAEPNTQTTYTVGYQCPGEGPQTFQYSGTRRVPIASEVKLETQWFWGRARTDRGAGCRILAVDGTPYQDQ
jgi:hypothetical protein